RGNQVRAGPLPDGAEMSAPRAPLTLEATGLSSSVVEQILIKSLYTGELTGHAAAERMRLAFPVIEPLIERVRQERLVEVLGGSGSSAAGYRYALTDLGRDRARQYLDINQYAGPAPVPLATYVDEMRARAQKRGYIDRIR